MMSKPTEHWWNGTLLEGEAMLSDGAVIAFSPRKDLANRHKVDPSELYCQWRFSLPLRVLDNGSSHTT